MTKIKKEPNILLIVIDALRARNLGCYGYRKRISPNIDNLAREGVLFENVYSCSNVTDSSLATIFSGKYPISHGIIRTHHRVRKEEIKKLMESGTQFLPEILKSKGYTMLAVDFLGRFHTRGYDCYINNVTTKTSTPANIFMSECLDLSLQSISRRFVRLRKSSLIDEAHVVSDLAKNLIRKYHSKKFFLFIHFWDTHCPYGPPINYYKNKNQIIEGIFRHPKTLKNLVLYFVQTVLGHEQHRVLAFDREHLARYDAAIAFVDHEIGSLIKTLEKHNILDQTLIMLTSDHGESLTENRIYFDHHGLYDPVIHVPLIFRYSDFPKNKKINSLIQHTDIAPTILNLLGIKTDSLNLDGKSLIPLIFDRTEQIHSAVFAEEAYWERKRAVRTRKYKYIYALSKKEAVCTLCKRIHGGVKELYDLRKDPNETHNIIREKPLTANMLKRQIYYQISKHTTEKTRIKEKIKKLKDSGKI